MTSFKNNLDLQSKAQYNDVINKLQYYMLNENIIHHSLKNINNNVEMIEHF